MTLGNRIGQYRRKLGLTQEALAQKLDVTNQAVSKWESDQCCPDISLLPRIADIFGITMDELFGRASPAREEPQPAPEPPEEQPEPENGTESPRDWMGSLWGKLFHRTIGDFDHREKVGREVPIPDDIELDWEDDQTLRVALFVGKKLIAGHPARERIEFCYEGPALNIHSECNIICDTVAGNVWAGGDVTCDSVGGSVRAGGDATCDSVSGPVQAGGDVSCDDVSGNVTAGGDVNCGDVNGYVQTNGDVSCDTVHGDVKAGGDVSCDEVLGNVTASGDVSCDEIQGNVQAGGDVDCDHLEGSITAGGSVNIG